MKQKHVTNLIKASMIVGGLGMSFAATQLEAEAHGWIVNDRAHLSSSRGGNRNSGVGRVEFEPQSAGEASRRIVEEGRATLNEAITSGSGSLGTFSGLAQHGGNGRTWARTNMNTGANTLTWNFTAAHRTGNINYYITRQGFDYRAPLNYDDFVWIQTFSYGGNSPAATNTAHRHNITIPSDRTGNHVILATWHVSDANVTWYRVIDITLPGVTGPFTPTPPRVLPVMTAPAFERGQGFLRGDLTAYDGYVWRSSINQSRTQLSPRQNPSRWGRVGRLATTPAPAAPAAPAPAAPAAPAPAAPTQTAPALDQQYVQLVTAMNGATPMAAVGNRIELGLGQSIERQTFRFIRSGSSYLIQSVEDGRFLTEQSQAVALTDQSSANSLWNLVDYADGRARLRNNATQRFMDVSGGNTTADGTQIITWTGNNGPNQRWLINITESPIVEVPVIVEPVQPEVALPEVVVPVQPEAPAQPAPAQPASALDQQYVQLMTAMNGATPMAAVGNRIELGLGQSIQRQTFRFIRSGSSYLIQSVEDGRFLTEQSQAVALTDQSSANSLWNLVDYADGSARLRNNATQRFMDVSGGNTTADGTQIITWTGHNGANQRWLINITESPIVEVPVIVEPVQPEVVLPEVVAPAPVQPEVVAPAPVQPEVVAPAQPEVEVESGLPVMSAQAWTHGSVLRGHLRSYRGFVYEARFNLSGQMNSPVNRPDRWIRVGRTQ